MTELSHFDPKILVATMAMYGSPGSLSAKLGTIWELTLRMILAAERGDHGHRVRKAWGAQAADALQDDSLPRRAAIAAKHGLLNREEDGSLISVYFGALGEVRKVLASFAAVSQGEIAKVAQAGTYDPEKIRRELCHPDHLKTPRYLNEVVTSFFALQLRCYHLLRMLESPAGIPHDPLVRRRRASAGAMASNHGEDLLRSEVADYLRTIDQGTKYFSVEDLFKAHVLNFGQVLDIYKTKLGKNVDGKPVKYGSSLSTDGILRKIRQWRKDDPEFGDLLGTLVVPRNRMQG